MQLTLIRIMSFMELKFAMFPLQHHALSRGLLLTFFKTQANYASLCLWIYKIWVGKRYKYLRTKSHNRITIKKFCGNKLWIIILFFAKFCGRKLFSKYRNDATHGESDKWIPGLNLLCVEHAYAKENTSNGKNT